MPEEQVLEANTTPDQDFNSKADAILDKFEASSASKETTVTEETQDKETGVDQSKKAIPETDESKLSSEEVALKRINEALGDDTKAIEAYIKRMGYHKDPAWQKLLAKSKAASVVDEETLKQVEEFKKVTSTPDYIRASMKQQGYTEDAINKKLSELGHNIEVKPDDFALVTSKLGIDPSTMDENTKATVNDITKIARVIVEDMLGKSLPGTIKPIEETVKIMEQQNSASKLMATMHSTVDKEGVLDFAKDIEPELHKFLDVNPDATQEDLNRHFSVINHTMTIERLKQGKKQVDRSETKSNNRPLSTSNQTGLFKLPKKTGNFNKDADAVLDALGMPD